MKVYRLSGLAAVLLVVIVLLAVVALFVVLLPLMLITLAAGAIAATAYHLVPRHKIKKPGETGKLEVIDAEFKVK